MTITMIPAGPGLPPLPRLQVVIRSSGDQSGALVATEREVELTIHHAGATVDDLALALGLTINDGGHPTLLVDGLAVGGGLPLRSTGVRRGSVITVPTWTDETVGETSTAGLKVDVGDGDALPPKAAGAVLRTLAGPDAGRELWIGPGRHVLGRGADVDVRVEDPGLARRQAVIEVKPGGEVVVTDLVAPHPTRVDGVVLDGVTPLAAHQLLAMSSTRIEVSAAAPDVAESGPTAQSEVGSATVSGSAPRGMARPGWTQPLHRPPLPATAPAVPPVSAPPVAPAPGGSAPLGIAAVVVTLVASSLVALVMHQPAFLLLGAVGAIGTLGAAAWQRGRGRSRHRAERGRHRDALARFAVDLAVHQSEVASRRRTDTMELPDAVACARAGGVELWARRATAANAYSAVVGRGDQVARPALAVEGSPVAEEAWVLVEAASVLTDVPVAVELGLGAVVGVVGPKEMAEAVARSLILQLVVAHGPSDLALAALFPTVHAPQESSWLRWLPHTIAGAAGDSLVAVGDEVTSLITALDREAAPRPSGRGARPARDGVGRPLDPGDRAPAQRSHLLLVVHDPTLLAARNAPTRQLLASDPSVAVLVVADDTAALPSICHKVIEVRADGTAALHRPGHAELADQVAIAGASAATARKVALVLAGLHDPEQPVGAAAAPATASLAELLGTAVQDPEVMRSGWNAAGDDPPLSTLLAVAADGPVEVDLVRDGPHVLVAGTTGAGKSELLRSLVAGLAARSGPDHLSFVLIDYKGGAAFDACANLPHVVGLVTDLDEDLAERALRSLHAELRRREMILRDAGAPELASYRAMAGHASLARLVVVVDEFATLATDLPGFVPSLVGIAQRGRSLGVHLVLATQRPAGAVSDDIRANTNLRIALRVQDAADSIDVVGDPLAASFPRHRPGRAVVRFGAGELVPVQVAAVSRAEPDAAGLAITVEGIGELATSGGASSAAEESRPGRGSQRRGQTTLEVLAATARAAAADLGSAPHRPWLPSLPEDLPWEELPAGAAGLVDDPDHQSQEPWTWEPTSAHLLCVGTVGTGITTALTSLTLAAAAVHSPSALHVYVVDGGSPLGALADLPHVGATIGPTEDERQARLIRRLAAMLHRGGAAACTPRVLVVVDRLSAWRHAVAERLGPDLADLLDRILVEGPAAGVVLAAGVDRPGSLPLAVSGAVGERLVLRLADPADAVIAGVRPALVNGLPRGRAVLAGSGLTVQLARPQHVAGAMRRIEARWAGADPLGGAPAVPCLPVRVEAGDLPSPPRLGGGNSGGAATAVVIGLGGAALEPVSLPMHPGDHLLIAGPARSGRSSALMLLGEKLRAADPRTRVVAVTPRRSPVADASDVEVVRSLEALEPLLSPPGAPSGGSQPRLVILVDDAELVEDVSQTLARVLEGAAGPVNVIAAGRVDALRAAYGHWTQVLRRQRRGLVLRPEADLDGDVLGTLLPRWEPTPPAIGRGYLVAEGECALVQLAVLDPSPAVPPR